MLVLKFLILAFLNFSLILLIQVVIEEQIIALLLKLKLIFTYLRPSHSFQIINVLYLNLIITPMANDFNEAQKYLADQDLPEFVSYLPKEKYTKEIEEKLSFLNKSSIAEIIANNEFLPYISDFFGIPQEADLNAIEKLLSNYKPVDGDFFQEAKIQPVKSEFTTASCKPITAINNKKESDKIDNECNVDEYLIDKIRKEILETNLDVNWDDIVGLNDVKKVINEIVLWPMMRPDIFTGLRGPPKGLLLFGPPGTGKTMIGKCIASQCKATFFSISASSLTSKWVGEGEKMVRAMFYLARKMSPSVIFIDEIDSLLSQRSDNEDECSRRIKTEFLVQFDGAAVNDKDRLLVIGATNRPQEIDEAARRRLVKRIYVPLPESDSRKLMVKHLLKNYGNEISEEDYNEISKITEGYSGSDMFNLCREATLEPLREIKDINTFRAEDTRLINVNDFKNATRQIRKSVSQKDLKTYLEWNELFGSMSL